MPKRNVTDVIEGEWYEWNRHERWVCCDCSLVHSVDYRWKDDKLEIRMYRRNRSTAAYRRGRGIKVVCKDGNNRNSGRNNK